MLVVPGLVYRRDVGEPHQVREPHQVDVWHLRSTPGLADPDLDALVATVVAALLPGARWRAVPARHP